MKPQLNILIVTCAHREISTTTVQSMEIFRLSTNLLYAWIIYSNDALIGRARSIACTHFYERHLADYMLFIDDDIAFRPDDIEKVYRELLDGKDLVGGCYVVKDGSQLASACFTSVHKLDGRVVPIDYVATGFMGFSHRLIDRMVNELKLPLLHQAIWARCYPFFESGRHWDETLKEDIYISEDWNFCNKARQLGVQPYLHTGIWLGHQGIKIWDLKDLAEHQRRQGIELEPLHPATGKKKKAARR
jgi:hypothetical protein